MAHASSSNIGSFLEKRGYIPLPEQKSASSTTAVPLSEWLLGSKPALVTRLLTYPAPISRTGSTTSRPWRTVRCVAASTVSEIDDVIDGLVINW